MPGPSPICFCAGMPSRRGVGDIESWFTCTGFRAAVRRCRSPKRCRAAGSTCQRPNPTDPGAAAARQLAALQLVRFSGAAVGRHRPARRLRARALCRGTRPPRRRTGRRRPFYPDRAFGRRHAGGRRDRRRAASARRALPVRRALRPRPGKRRPDARDRDDRPLAGSAALAGDRPPRRAARRLHRAADRRRFRARSAS